MTNPDGYSASRFGFRMATVLICVVASGCVQTAKSLVEVSSLRAKIIKASGEPGVQVDLNNNASLTVTFINSPLNEKTPEARQQRAKATAELVKRHYLSMGKIKEIWVGFVRQKSSYFVITQTEGLEYFGFDQNGSPLVVPASELASSGNGEEFQPKAVYSAIRKQTDVSITRLQLAGDLNEGLILTPHFTVPGDATGLKRSALPATVNLDFTCYSKQILYSGETKVSALIDGNAAFTTFGSFTSSKLAQEKYSAFLFLRVAYTDFRRMVAGEKLVLWLGDDKYELTAEQLRALREMTEYVRE